MRPINTYIDHTLLKPEASKQEIIQLCQEAEKYGFASVCILPIWVQEAKLHLKDSPVKVCSVVGFPLGGNQLSVKMAEAVSLAHCGADELDMVMNLGALKSQNYAHVIEEIRGVIKAAPHCVLKVIIETCLLTDEEKRLATLMAMEAGAHYVKTSTGFSHKGAQLEDIKLIKETVGTRLGVKASGGIKDLNTAVMMIQAGACRLGTSSGVRIVSEIHDQL